MHAACLNARWTSRFPLRHLRSLGDAVRVCVEVSRIPVALGHAMGSRDEKRDVFCVPVIGVMNCEGGWKATA